ncbi:MAG TPA: exosortase-associated EpsI family protein [Chthonomonadales bacterium]|nr:exosortase-associated EpsI family protein [Chthonomonadales bacterium]
MQHDKVLAAVALLMACAALAVSALARPVREGKSFVVPVAQFPSLLAGWECVSQTTEKDYPEEVRHKLPTAHVVDRHYMNALGQTVELLLLTADNQEEFHDPSVCFPDQGFSLQERRQWVLAGQRVQSFAVKQPGKDLFVLYWWAGDFESERPHPRWLQEVYKIRNKVQNEEGSRIFARMVCTDTPDNRAAMIAFARSVIGPVRALACPDLPSAGAASLTESRAQALKTMSSTRS